MSTCEHIVLMASYNTWINTKLYDAASRLSTEEFARDRGAFFGSILGTLNHVAVADTIWLKRFSTHPSQHSALLPIPALPTPKALDELLFDNLTELREYRQRLDDVIVNWSTELTETDLSHILRYTNMQGVATNKSFRNVIMHFFNHQTHHRGQATTLLFQAGQDVGVTDLIMLIADEDQI